MKKVIATTLIGVMTWAFDTVLLPYGAYIDYSGTTNRDNASLVGAYYSTTKLPYKLEIALEHMQLSYTDNTPTYKQNALTLLLHYFRDDNWDYRIGINNIFTKQGSDDEYQKVFIGGLEYYELYNYNVGTDVYFTDYKGFHVWQITPKIGKSFGNYNSDLGSFYLEGRIDYIRISDNAAKKDNYTTFDIKFQNFKGPWTTTLEGSFGKNSYRIDKGGFVVYNLGEEYKYSYGISIAKAIDETSSLKIGYTRSRFELNSNNTDSNLFLLAYTRAF